MCNDILYLVVPVSNPYFRKWNGRLWATILDYMILYLGAYSSKPVYPYSVHSELVKLLNEDLAPPLPTIYSTIDRLKDNFLISINQEISGGRVQKTVTTTPEGFEMMEIMEKEIGSMEETIQKIKDIFEVI